jgi:uncharacterized membrane protein
MTNITYVRAPGWSASLSFGWDRMKQYFLPLLLVVLVIAVANVPMDTIEKSIKEPSTQKVLLQIVAAAYWLLLLPVFEYSADLMFVQAVRSQKLEFHTLLAGFHNYLYVVLAHLMVSALIGLALVALIIPGIIVACRLAFFSYLILDKGLDPIAAVETSWKMTSGYGWTIFGLGLTSIFICFVGLLCLIVGILPALIWVKASFAALYEAILIEKGESITS